MASEYLFPAPTVLASSAFRSIGIPSPPFYRLTFRLRVLIISRTSSAKKMKFDLAASASRVMT